MIGAWIILDLLRLCSSFGLSGYLLLPSRSRSRSRAEADLSFGLLICLLIGCRQRFVKGDDLRFQRLQSLARAFQYSCLSIKLFSADYIETRQRRLQQTLGVAVNLLKHWIISAGQSLEKRPGVALC
jgi:hypothetical protein